MPPIEILATIFAVLVLLKILIRLTNPMLSVKIAEAILKESLLATFIYLILAVAAGYYIFSAFSIVEVSAIFLFASLLIGLTFAPYSKQMIKLAKEILANKSEYLKKEWLVI